MKTETTPTAADFRREISRLCISDAILFRQDGNRIIYAWQEIYDGPWSNLSKKKVAAALESLRAIPTPPRYPRPASDLWYDIFRAVEDALAGKTDRIPANIWDGR